MVADSKPLYAQLIRGARHTRLFLSQEAFAKLIQQLAHDDGKTDVVLEQSTVSRWESGEAVPALRYRKYIAEALGIDASVIFTEVAA